MSVESTMLDPAEQFSGLAMAMLGPLALSRGGEPIALPHSRKTRALLAYLVLSPHPVSRDHLCELLWDVPNDPRGELRWCLSKLRGLLDEHGLRRVQTEDDRVWLDLTACQVDLAVLKSGAPDVLQHAEDLWTGEFLEGLHIDHGPRFQAWLTAQRWHWRSAYIDLIERIISDPSTDAARRRCLIERWVTLSPFDERAHVLLLTELRQSGAADAAAAHLRATMDLFRSEDLDLQTLRNWRASHAMSSPARPAQEPVRAEVPSAHERAALAVMPFVETAGPSFGGGLGAGLTQDIITRLARLRSLSVIARGSVYALSEAGLGDMDAARKLGVAYMAGGTVNVRGGRLKVEVELVDVRSGRIVWSDVFERAALAAFDMLEDIGDQIVSSIASEIETVERNLAILKPPNSLTAWEAYHRGLWHMYRFTKAENETARQFFQQSVTLDPTYARAHAGLSFTHWQSGFQHWGDREEQREFAYAAASEAVLADDHDPAAHWAMGRALWMRGQDDRSVVELEQAIALSPNFALGHYALSFVGSQSGDPLGAIVAADHARRLSPFDPLLFGMLGTRAIAHVRLGQFAEAAEWAARAAARPNAHYAIHAILAYCLALAGQIDPARVAMAGIHAGLPAYGVNDFLQTFRFAPEAEAEFRRAAKLIAG
ncbi:transcriptional regulator [Devosia sp. XJ19-1]|uniref:Transcriptional regulator n=1 Tax=Devosia ureilytica TaxID=2952754 RepID=A0A9Q4FR11_9HYPH|nr:BTAD domain-containing putative transcriptional regulator [Devosia ureilytica]MCP8882401.1 transcriptional regulator [Devosia ureilytica]MCP8885712.1 transcriptional regulator [Devosia ureilytica]